MKIEILRSLATDVDSVVVMGAPNVRFIARVDVDRNDIVIAYRQSTDECKILAPLEFKERLSALPQSRCRIVYYSYDIREKEGYVIGRNFGEILVGFLKSFIEPRTLLAVPFRYIDLSLAHTLHKYWSLKDISKEIASVRARKSYEDLEAIATIFSSLQNILKELRILRSRNVVEEYLKHVTEVVDAVYIEPLAVSEEVVSFYTYVKKDIYRLGFRTSIPLGEDTKRFIDAADAILKKTLESIAVGTRCTDAYRTVKTQLDIYSGRGVYIDVYGIGTEVHEYPSLSDFLYNNCSLDTGMAIMLEAALRKSIYLSKLVIIKEGVVCV